MAEENEKDFSWDTWPLETMMMKSISVPIYQRSYAWEDEQVNDFLNDLDHFSNTSDLSYLFGLAILMKASKNKNVFYELIDGQQRLTTALIFVSVVRDIATELSLPKLDFFKTRASRYIGGEDYEGIKYNLTLGKENREFFLKYIQEYPKASVLKEPAKSSSNHKIWNAYKIIHEHLKNKIEEKSNQPEQQSDILKEYLSNLTEKFKLSVVITNDIGQSYTIFETLNSRGLDLDGTDLLKNYFFEVCDGEKDIVEKWNNMIDELKSNKVAPTDFIRCYWNSRYAKNETDFCRKKQLFKCVKKKIGRDPKAAKEFLNCLSQQYLVYLDLKDPDKSKLFTDDQKKPLNCLKNFNLKTFYPLILALKSIKITPAKLTKCLCEIESLIIRNMIVGGESPNSFETEFASWASTVYSGTNTDIDNVMKKIVNKTISDSEFKKVFVDCVPDSNSKAKSLLWNIYNEDYTKERPIDDSTSKIHLEHIMPQNNNIWKVDEKFHESYKGRIGNMTLLDKKLNESASNDLLENKSEQYQESEIKQNHDLTKFTTETWTAEVIEARQEYFFDAARKRWPVNDKDKQDLPEDYLKDNLWKKKIEENESESDESEPKK